LDKQTNNDDESDYDYESDEDDDIFEDARDEFTDSSAEYVIITNLS